MQSAPQGFKRVRNGGRRRGPIPIPRARNGMETAATACGQMLTSDCPTGPLHFWPQGKACEPRNGHERLHLVCDCRSVSFPLLVSASATLRFLPFAAIFFSFLAFSLPRFPLSLFFLSLLLFRMCACMPWLIGSGDVWGAAPISRADSRGQET